MSSKRARKQSIFIRYMRGPIRALARARDLYVKSLTGCGGPVVYGNAMGCPTPHIPSIPRSFSVNTSNSNYRTAEEELRDLIRLASTRRLTGKFEAELHRSRSAIPFSASGVSAAAASVPRSNTVAFGRIDEEKSFEYGEEDDVGLLGGVNYPRTRSYAVPRRIKTDKQSEEILKPAQDLLNPPLHPPETGLEWKDYFESSIVCYPQQ
ncbi:hypothetical protein DH2020_016067 [Rehmannia glutinosa]|uniref:Uncharacterized protein n=1 Tax=Rehmannia glutinosa TaxID=99300 RepID=A0ABR0WY55_REHGL